MKDQITIYSRSNNDVLFEIMKSFIPEGYNVVKCDQFNEWQQAADYLYHIIDTCPTRWAINIDIDCFVYNWEQVLKKIDKMWDDISWHYGMPDTFHFHPGRFHSAHSMNPFFNIFYVDGIKDLKEQDGLSWQEIGNTFIGRPNQEPFAGFFQWLKINKKPTIMQLAILC